MKRSALVVATVLLLVASGCSSDPAPAPATTTAAPSSTTTALAPVDDQRSPTSVNGLVVQGDTVWVASISDDMVLQFDADTGEILRRIETNGAAPDDLALAPDGSIWVTGFGNGDLGRISDGRYEVVTKLEPGINPVAVDEDGVVWVGTYGPDGDLYRIDPTSLDPETPPAPIAEGTLPDINAFGILDDGTIVAPAGGLGGPGSAVAIAPDGSVTTIVDHLPPVAAGTVDDEGNAYVLANVTGEVIQVDVESKTSEVEATASVGSPFDNLAFAPDGTLYLSSFITPTVTRIDPDGTERQITIGS